METNITNHYYLLTEFMYYIPKRDNPVFVQRGNGGFNWIPFSTHVFKECMDSNTPIDVVASYFPGPTFLGRLINPANKCDMALSLNVLRAIRNAHEKLKGKNSLINQANAIAHRVAIDVEDCFKKVPEIRLCTGKGYSKDLNSEYSIPQCHIYTFELELTDGYAAWLSSRLKSYSSIASVFDADYIYYLKLSHRAVIVGNDHPKLKIDIYGTQSLSSEWANWLDEYESNLPDDEELSGLELVAGLLHLADTIATIHMMSAVPVIACGELERRTADDNLTDFWLMCYDVQDDVNYSVGSCEVCGELFVGSSKQKRGHASCMNRQRVFRAKARKFNNLISEGFSPEEAALKASISPATASKFLERQV